MSLLSCWLRVDKCRGVVGLVCLEVLCQYTYQGLRREVSTFVSLVVWLPSINIVGGLLSVVAQEILLGFLVDLLLP